MNFFFKFIGALTSKPYAFLARSWELENLNFIDFYDSILSNIRLDIRGLSIMRVLPRVNEKLNEEWISDKIRFSYDSFRRQRIVNPMVKYDENFINISWEESFFYFFFKYNLKSYDLGSFNTVKILGLFGRFIDLESTLMFRNFLDSFKLSPVYFISNKFNNVSNRVPFNFLLNTKVSSLEKSDCIVLIGTNIRYSNPVLHIKLLKMGNQGVPIFTFGNLSSIKIKAYSFGFSIKFFLNFLQGKNKYSLFFFKSKSPFILFGDSIFRRTDVSSTEFNFFEYFKNLSTISVGYLTPDVSDLSFLSLGVPFKNDFKFKNDISAYNFIYNYNSDDILLNANLSNNFFIYQGHHGDYGANMSKIVYPSTFLIEKNGTFLNLDGNFVKYGFVLKPASNIRLDWKIFKALTLYFNNKIFSVVNTFLDLQNLVLNYIPSFSKNNLVNSFFVGNVLTLTRVRLENTPFSSIYISYYMTDQVSRSSKIMALSYMKFKNNFINFNN